MASQASIPFSVYIDTLSCRSFTPPASCVLDASIVAAAGVQASKLQHQYEPVYQQEAATNAASETRIVHVVKGATATVVSFDAGAVTVLTGNATTTVNLKKNGTTILSAVISLASTDTNYGLDSGTVSNASLVAGDVLSVTTVATVNAGALPKGVFSRLVLREDAA